MLISLTFPSPLQIDTSFAVSSHDWGTHPPTPGPLAKVQTLSLGWPSASPLTPILGCAPLGLLSQMLNLGESLPRRGG